MNILKDFYITAQFVVQFVSITYVLGGLQPYYLHFPPPLPLYPIPNGLESPDIFHNQWSSHNSTLSRSLPNGPFPLIIHTWAKPEVYNGVKLENGTIIYYMPPPWGGMRSLSPATTPPSKDATNSNSVYDSDDYTSGGKEVERQSLFEDPTRQSGYSTPAGWQAPNIDITTPPAPTRSETNWGTDSATSTQLYDKLAETTTSKNPFTTQTDNSTSAGHGIISTSINLIVATPDSAIEATPTTPATISTTTTTEDSIAASTNARYPVSESVRKFRRIVAQIRAITKKELGAQKRTRS